MESPMPSSTAWKHCWSLPPLATQTGIWWRWNGCWPAVYKAWPCAGIVSQKVSQRLHAVREEKLPTVVYNQDIDASLRDCFVGQNSYQSGLCARR